MHTLYNNEVLEEEAIWKWVEEQDEDKTFVTLAENFLNWLKTADEEEEDEDDQEEEDD
jgi:translation initiation factor eIF-2B subunit epsilon